jgi:hypothetical protein
MDSISWFESMYNVAQAMLGAPHIERCDRITADLATELKRGRSTSACVYDFSVIQHCCHSNN